MLDAYELFEIRFLGSGPLSYLVEAHCDLSGEASGTFRAPTGDPAYQRILAQLAALDTDEALLGELGGLLFRALFQGELEGAYLHAQAALPQGHGLRISLAIDATQAELAQLPWEFLCDPGGYPLAMLNASIVRYLRMTRPRPRISAPRPLRVLVTAAATEPKLAVERELAEIRAALADLEAQQLVHLRVEEHTTRRQFQRLLREEFQIWHFVGHGGLSRDGGERTLLFEDGEGDAEACNARELRILLEDSGLQAVILSACESAGVTASPYGSFAPALMEADIGALIAMQFRMPEEASRPFAGEFYRALVNGAPIDACVTEGRKAIMQASGLRNPDWGVPVVYTRARSGRLFEAPKPLDLPEEAPPPSAAHVVGRADELARYAAELRSRHLVVVSGLAGVGKSAFGQALAALTVAPAQAFHFTFGAVDGVDALLRDLAMFLARRGQPTLWQQLENARANNTAPPNPTSVFDQLRQGLRGRGYLLCIDNAHLADDDPQIRKFGEFLTGETGQGAFGCIVISRSIPSFTHELRLGPLPGLSLADAGLLLRARGLELAGPLLADLHARTAGNAQLLVLAISVLQQSGDKEQSLRQLDQHNDLERYLMREVDAMLSEEQRAIMRATSVLLGDGATRPLIEALCTGQRVRRELLALNDRFLLEASMGPAGEIHRPPAILQAFYYDDLVERERAELHGRAAAFYEASERDPLRAAIHYQRGGEPRRAASLATAHVLAAINAGQSHALASLLERFAADQLDQRQWIEVLIARGRVYVLQRRKPQARANFEAALAALAALPPSPDVLESRAQIFCNLGELTRLQSPDEALGYLREGLAALAALGDAPPTESQQLRRGRILATIGLAHLDAGEYEQARRVLLQALEHQPDALAEWRARALNNLGIVEQHLGNLAQAHEFYSQARSIYERFQNYWEIVSIWLNLGLVDEHRGQLDAAATNFNNALALTRTTANIVDQAVAEVNLGNLYLKRGEIELALGHLNECIQLAQEHQLDSLTAAAQSTLADMHVRLRDWEHAAPLAAEARRLAEAAQADFVLPEVFRSLAQCARSQPRERLRLALCGLRAAVRLHDPREIGLSLRAVGLAHLALGHPERARTRLERSLAHLNERDVYELARSQRALARVCELHGPPERAAELSAAAQATFTQLGAALDLREDTFG